jgi:hypothetical protein
VREADIYDRVLSWWPTSFCNMTVLRTQHNRTQHFKTILCDLTHLWVLPYVCLVRVGGRPHMSFGCLVGF